MIRRITTAAVALTLGLAVNISAHSPEGAIFPAFQWPAGLEPVLDGVGSEYDIVPDAYWQTTEQFPDTQGGREIDASNFDAKATVTYSLGTNRLYFYSEVFDDINRPGDTWQILLDADHSGGECYPGDERLDGSQCYQTETYNNIGDTLLGSEIVHFFWGAATWLPEEGWYNAVATFEGDHYGPGTTWLEIRLAPTDDINPAGPGDSILHEMQENNIIGIHYNWMDYDVGCRQAREGEECGGWDAFYNLSQSDIGFRNADGCSDFFLSPVDESVDFGAMTTSVEATTWGRLKAGFVD